MADKVRVVWGQMKISPVQYSNFDLGPFEFETEVRSAETPEEAMDRAYTVVEGFAKKSYAKKIALFKEAYSAACSAAVRGR